MTNFDAYLMSFMARIFAAKRARDAKRRQFSCAFCASLRLTGFVFLRVFVLKSWFRLVRVRHKYILLPFSSCYKIMTNAI